MKPAPVLYGEVSMSPREDGTYLLRINCEVPFAVAVEVTCLVLANPVEKDGPKTGA